MAPKPTDDTSRKTAGPVAAPPAPAPAPAPESPPPPVQSPTTPATGPMTDPAAVVMQVPKAPRVLRGGTIKYGATQEPDWSQPVSHGNADGSLLQVNDLSTGTWATMTTTKAPPTDDLGITINEEHDPGPVVITQPQPAPSPVPTIPQGGIADDLAPGAGAVSESAPVSGGIVPTGGAPMPSSRGGGGGVALLALAAFFFLME